MSTPLQQLIIDADVDENDWDNPIVQAISDPQMRGYMEANLESILDSHHGEDARQEWLHLVEQVEDHKGPLDISMPGSGPRSCSFELPGPSILAVKAETSGPKGGDAGHGGYTRITLRSIASFYMETTVELGMTGSLDRQPGEVYRAVQPEAITLTVRGDSEMAQLRDGLRRVLSALEEQ